MRKKLEKISVMYQTQYLDDNKKEGKCKKIELKYIWRKDMENGSKEKKTNSSKSN